MKYLILILIMSVVTYANHPNEGQLNLAELYSEAIQNNEQIQILESKIQEQVHKKNKTESAYYPKIDFKIDNVLTRDQTETSEQIYKAYAEMTYNIYNGGKDIHSNNLVSYDMDILKSQSHYLKSHLKTEISELYYEILFYLESMTLNQKSLEMNAEQKKAALIKSNSGLSSISDVLEFELREATLQSELLLLKQELSKKTNELNLKLGRDSSKPLASIKGHLHKETKKINPQIVLDHFNKNNLTLKELQVEVQKNKTRSDLIKSEFLPKLNLEAKYGNLSSLESYSQNMNQYEVTVNLTFPLFSGFDSMQSLRQNQEETKVSQLNFSLTQKELLSELKSEMDHINLIQDRLELEEKNLSKSDQYYKLTLSEYKKGIKNSPDLLEATQKVLETQIKNLEYRKDYYLKRLKIIELLSLDPENVDFL